MFCMDNPLKPLKDFAILQHEDSRGCSQLVLFDILRIFYCINLFDGEVECFLDPGIDRSLLHAPHASRLEKAKYLQCHEA